MRNSISPNALPPFHPFWPKGTLTDRHHLGEGEWEAPLGRHGSPRVAADDAGRGWDLGKITQNTAARCLGVTTELLP